MVWALVIVVIVIAFLVFGYRSDKRVMNVEADRLSAELRQIFSCYKSNTYDERPVVEIRYLLGFIGSYIHFRLQRLGLKPATIRAHDLLPKIFESSEIGAFNGGQSTGFEIFYRIDQLALSNDPEFMSGHEHGLMNAGFRLNCLKSEFMSHHLINSAFDIAKRRGVGSSYEAVGDIHMELLFNSSAPKSRKYIAERVTEEKANPTPFPF